MSAPTIPVIKTLILNNNDKGILPANVQILSVAVDGFISVTSSCNNLPTPVPYKCYHLEYGTDIPDGGDSDLFREDSIIFYGLRVNGVETLFQPEITDGGDTVSLQNAIIAIAPYLKNVLVTTTRGSAPPSYRDRRISFKAPENIGSSFELIMGASGFGGESKMTVYIKAFEVTC